MKVLRWCCATVAVLWLHGLVAPVSAQVVPTIWTPLHCWIEGTPAAPVVYGSGFPPSPAEVVLDYQPHTSLGAESKLVVDSQGGTFETGAPPLITDAFWIPRPVTLYAIEYGGSSNSPAASLTVPMVYRSMNQTYFTGRPWMRLRWRFAGLPDATIYAHYLMGNGSTGRFRYVATAVWGSTSGPCGTLTVRRRLFRGIHLPAYAPWRIQFDTSRRFHLKSLRSWYILTKCGDTGYYTNIGWYMTFAPCGLP